MATKRIKDASQYKRERNPQKFEFSISKESTKFNFNLLKKHDFNLEKILNPGVICVIYNGHELKSVKELDNL